MTANEVEIAQNIWFVEKRRKITTVFNCVYRKINDVLVAKSQQKLTSVSAVADGETEVF